MDARAAKIADLLHEAAETHHIVYRIVDGDYPDWATWYSNWLATLSELPDIVGRKPVRSDLTHLLVALDREFTESGPGGRWEDYYAERILKHFGAG